LLLSIFENKKGWKGRSLRFAPEEPCVEILEARIVAAHINKFSGILRVLEQFAAGRAARVVVVQVQARWRSRLPGWRGKMTANPFNFSSYETERAPDWGLFLWLILLTLRSKGIQCLT
jgi:hypothetical protein